MQPLDKPKILIIDDEIDICNSLTFALEDAYTVASTIHPLEGLSMLIKERFHVVLLDLKIGTVDGIDVLKEIKSSDPAVEVIIMTAFGSIVSSVDAIKSGAYTYLTKPLDLNVLYRTVSEAVALYENSITVDYMPEIIGDVVSYHGIIGRSTSMDAVFKKIERLKDVDTSVVITGESGTGKELVARAIHFAGKRKNAPFVDINCAAIPETLLEEELFGHLKGAFTGATSDKLGKFQFAEGGTIFLDEIGDMPLSLQSKLLRVLQQREVTPIGGNRPQKINVRVIAATNQDLKKSIEDGTFRRDLYFRLNVIEIALPPLRERKNDLNMLFQHFIEQYNDEMNKSVKGFNKESEDKMLAYDYPGNVRELANIIECAVLLSQGDYIDLDCLPVEVAHNQERLNDVLDLSLGKRFGADHLVGLTLQEAEKKLIEAALKLNKGRKATAIMLGISERGLRNKINEYGL